jgi:hypothetical protein
MSGGALHSRADGISDHLHETGAEGPGSGASDQVQLQLGESPNHTLYSEVSVNLG